MPGPDSTPEQVIAAYIDAVSARDFETANVIDARPGSDLGRFSRPTRIQEAQGMKTLMEGEQAHVVFNADFDGGDGSVEGGPWGYYLERGNDGSWYIVDAGVA